MNLETAVTNRGRPQPKTYHFRTTPAAFSALRDAGVDLVTLANNHVLDYGQTGLTDTLAAAKAAHFPYVGVGVNAAAAWAPYVTTIDGTKIAIIGVSQVAELASSWVATAHRPDEANAINLGRTLATVRAARRLARIVIVFMHWGTEGTACPDPNQLSAGAEAGRGGGEHHHRRVRAHAPGLGLARPYVRRLWDGQFFVVGELLQHRHRGAQTHVAPALTARFIPAVVSRTGQPIRDHGAAARRALAHYASLRACAGLSAHPPSGSSRRS